MCFKIQTECEIKKIQTEYEICFKNKFSYDMIWSKQNYLYYNSEKCFMVGPEIENLVHDLTI